MVPEDSAVAAWINSPWPGRQLGGGLVGGRLALRRLNQLQLLLPTPPIYNDEALLGNDGPVAQKVADLDPEIVITEGSARQAYPEINSVLNDGYQEVDESGSEIVWLRNDLVASVMGSAGLG